MTEKLIIVGNSDSVFINNLETELAKLKKTIVFNPYGGKDGRYNARIVKKVYLFLRFIYKALFLFKKDDVVLFCNLNIHVFWMIPILKWRARRVSGVAFGSDILRRNKSYDMLLKFGLHRMDSIHATNDNVLEEIKILKKEGQCASILRFGLPVFLKLDDLLMKRSKMLLETEKNNYKVAIGYCAEEGQRQEEIISRVFERREKLSHCEFLVPLQYGDMNYKNKMVLLIKKLNRSAGYSLFKIIDDFYDDIKMAQFRLDVDFLVNNSVSDAFSGSVQETIYAGNCVFADSALPYVNMPGFGTSIIQYNDIDDLLVLLDENKMLKVKENCKKQLEKTRRDLYQISAWETVIKQWEKII